MAELFKNSKFLQICDRNLGSIRFSAQSHQFLKQVRFPSQYESLSLKFFPTLNTLDTIDRQDNDLYVLGVEYDFRLESLARHSDPKSNNREFIYSYICIDRKTDRIICIEASNETFVNTNIICFASSLVAYKKAENQVEDRLDDDEYLHQATADLENRLLEIDPDALSSEESWWASVMGGILG